MKNAIVNGRKRGANITDNNKGHIDFVHKPNQHFKIIGSRSNLTIGLFILRMDH